MLTAAVVLGLLVAPQALAATFTVTTTADSGAGSLRQAILDANALAGLDTIAFAIPGAGEHTIQPVTGLPTITDAVVIDGSGQVDGNGRPLVRIDGGAGTAPSLYGLDFAVPTIASSSLDRLAFTRWDNGNGAGVRIGSAGGVSVTGSLFGTTASGATSQDAVSLGNYSGIQVENASTIGGIAAVDRNVISGNALNGIYVAGGNALITGNWIGVGVDGTTALGNGSRGVFVQAVDVEIGGVGTGEGNVIHNNGVGVEIIAGSAGVRVQGNSIRDNAGLGIDLAPSGVTANDAGDADTGPNGLQNFPVITSAVQSGGTLTVAGSFDSVDGPAYTLDFYVSSACDASGNGEGATYVGRLSETGVGSFNAAFASAAGSPNVVTATATDADGTSEFSACFSIENDLVVNGGFEEPVIPGGVETTHTFPSGDFGGWAVTRGGVQQIGTYWPAKGGAQSLDLDGNAADGAGYVAGTIKQVLATTPGQAYDLTFWYANNPDRLSNCGGVPAQMDVKWNSNVVLSPTHTGSTFGDMGWTLGQATVTATGAAATLEFVSADTPGCYWGIALDDVSVTASAPSDPSQDGPTFTVNSANDPGDGACTIANCTLREAILVAGSGDTIEFAIPGSGVKTVILSDALPTFFGALLDAWSQGGTSYTGPPLIEIDGSTTSDANGLEVGRDNATVRGLAIGGFTGYGVYVDAAYVSLFGNHVGTDAAGMVASPNAQGGVYVNDTEGAVIGGAADGEGNVVSGNGGHGIELPPAYGYTIQGNLIGVGADGTTPLGNSGAGVFAESCCGVDGTVGGAGAGEPNVIAFNGSAGIVMDASIGAMSISINSIHDNGGLGIDLGNDGLVAANDPGDTDSGPNGLQNFPVITSAVQSGGTLTVAGSFDSVDGPLYTLNFYVSSACDASGNGEGATYVGRLSEAGVGSFNAAFASAAAGPNVVTATATGDGGTSEFSACTTITAGGDPPQNGPTFTVTTASDHAPDGCTVADCTLRDAITDVNSSIYGFGNPATIEISPSTTGTVFLAPTAGGNGQLPAVARYGTTIRGNDAFRIDGGGDGAGEVAVGIQASQPAVTVDDLVVTRFQVGISNVGVVSSSIVGTDAASTPNLGNTEAGIASDTDATEVYDSTVSGNGIGIRQEMYGGIIQGNRIGVAHTGSAALGNTQQGILLDNLSEGGATIGRDAPSEAGKANEIAHNGGDGVKVVSGYGTRIQGNSIHDNAGLGINVNPPQTSAPAITAASIDGQVAVTFSIPPSGGSIDLYASPTCDPSGAGEGRTFLGRQDGAESDTSYAFPYTPSDGTVLTATITGGGPAATSPFSTCFDIAAAPSAGTVTLTPVADTFVAAGAPTTNFGSLDYADVYGGSNPGCVLANGTSYTLMRFNLSAIPAGATITDARLETTTRAGWAQDGDPAHWALFIPDDTWGESTVTWNTRPADGPTTVGGTAYSGGPDIRQSPLSFGAADVWRNGCGQDPDPAGNQTKVFPSSTDGMPRTVAEARAGLIAQIAAQRAGDGQLSLELWTPNCPVCTVGNNLAYWGRYYTREAVNPALRPKLVVTYGGGAPATVTNLTISGPATADAGAPAVPLLSIPPGALVVPQSSGTQAAPVNQSPVNQSPVNQLPVNQLPVNQSPVNQSPVNQLPVNQSPVNQSGLGLSFAALAQAPGPLGDTALSTIPLLRDGGWGAILPPTLSKTPLQSVTLRQVFGLNPLPVPLQPGATSPIRFADIDFSNSPLGSLPAMTLALGQLPVSGISGVDWCALFSGPPLNCSGSLPGSTSLLSAALEGAPVNQSPVNQSPVNQSLIDALATAQAPVNQLPVNQLPVNQLPVNQLPVNQSRILSLPVNQLPVNQSPVNQLSLAAILAANAPVNQSPVNQLPVNQLPVNQSVLVCSGQCTGTLGDYVGNVLPGVTLGDLRQALPNDVPDSWTIANLEDFANLIVGDLLESLPQPNDLTLADVLALALFANNPESFAFETLNIFDTSLSLYADPPGTTPYSVAFTLDPNGGATGGPSTVALSVTLPRTFAYAPGTLEARARARDLWLRHSRD